MNLEITNQSDLKAFYETLPEDTTSDRLGEDLEAGNFDDAHFVLPDGREIEVTYTGE